MEKEYEDCEEVCYEQSLAKLRETSSGSSDPRRVTHTKQEVWLALNMELAHNFTSLPPERGALRSPVAASLSQALCTASRSSNLGGASLDRPSKCKVVFKSVSSVQHGSGSSPPRRSSLVVDQSQRGRTAKLSSVQPSSASSPSRQMRKTANPSPVQSDIESSSATHAVIGE